MKQKIDELIRYYKASKKDVKRLHQIDRITLLELSIRTDVYNDILSDLEELKKLAEGKDETNNK